MTQTLIQSFYKNTIRNRILLSTVLSGTLQVCASDVTTLPIEILGASTAVLNHNNAGHAYIVPSVTSSDATGIVQVEMTGALDTTLTAGHGCYIQDVTAYTGAVEILANANSNPQGVFIQTPDAALNLADITIASSANALILNGSGNAGTTNLVTLASGATKTMTSGSVIYLVSQGLDLGTGTMSGSGVLTVNLLESTGGTDPEIDLGHITQLTALAAPNSIAPAYLSTDIGNATAVTTSATLGLHTSDFSGSPLVPGSGLLTNPIFNKLKIYGGGKAQINGV